MDLTRHELAGTGSFGRRALPIGAQSIPRSAQFLPVAMNSPGARAKPTSTASLTHSPRQSSTGPNARNCPSADSLSISSAQMSRVSALEAHRAQSGCFASAPLDDVGRRPRPRIRFIVAAVTDEVSAIDEDLALRLFLLPSRQVPAYPARGSILPILLERTMRERERTIIDKALMRSRFPRRGRAEAGQLGRRPQEIAPPRICTAIDKEIRELKREEKLAGSMPEKIAIKRKIAAGQHPPGQRRNGFPSGPQSRGRPPQGRTPHQVEEQLFQKDDRHDLFTIRWTLQ